MEGTTETPTLDQLQEALRRFGVWDYVVFVGSLFGCACVGLFYALRGAQSEDEYLMGGRTMSVFPVSLSLIASLISGIFLLGTPTEIYLYGTEYFFFIISIFLMSLISCYIFLPVFHQLKLTSTYEYFEKRFDKRLRLFGSVLFTVAMICWLPIVIYVPALAFNQVTGINVHIVTPCVCLVCIFYTSVGGLKAVVWTDVIQTWLMVGAFLVVVIKGTLDVGGFQEVWERSSAGGRLDLPSLDTDPTLRHSLLIIVIGGSLYWTQTCSLNQHMVQRYLTLSTLKQARQALFIFSAGVAFLLAVVCYTGLLVYATYYDCDPLQTNLARTKDQIVPLLVMQVMGSYPGMPGLFVSGIFSAALSSLSTGLNSMSAVFLEDFVKPYRKEKLSAKATSYIMRSVVVVFGIIYVSLVFLVERLGTVLQLTMSLGSLPNGPIFGVFVCGILLPWVNASGAFWGGIAGFFAGAVVIIGAQHAQSTGQITFSTKPTSTLGCDYTYNTTLGVTETLISDLHEGADVFPLFRMSYVWYTCFAGAVTVSVALLISCLSGFKHMKKIDPLCVFWPLRGFIGDGTSHNHKVELSVISNGVSHP